MSRKALLKRLPKAVEINGETVYVRSLTMREALRFDEMSNGPESNKAAQYLVQCATVDADGNPLFSVDDPEIGDIPTDIIRAIGEQIRKVSTPGSLEKAVKN